MNDPKIYLASKSPRRAELLRQIGVPFEPIAVECDEGLLSGESPIEYVRRVALAKARAGRALADARPVLAADTAVVVDDRTLGKPRDFEDFMTMMALLSDRAHQVLTAVACASDREEVVVNASDVRFRSVSPAEARAYWSTGEPVDKAGGYAIQGIGALFVQHLSGSYSGVMGLPLYETARLLVDAGVALRIAGESSEAHAPPGALQGRRNE